MRRPLEISKLRLRILTAADLPALTGLWAASWREAMPGIDFEARREWLIGRLNALHDAGSVTICAVDGSDRILGFVTIDPVTGYLDQLTVAQSSKGTGVARELMNEARRLSPSGIVLDVNADNARAIAFYEREGFLNVGEGTNPNSGLKTLRMRWEGKL
jgi:putative acetyltransferase